MLERMRRKTKKSGRRGVGIGTAGALLAASLTGATGALAQQPSPVGQFNDQTQPRTDPRIAEKPADPVRVGPLAPWATDMAERGLTFDINIYDFYQANPSAGLRTGEQSNSAYFVLSMTADMQRIANISGGTIKFTQTFFGLVRNLNMAADIGDTTLGYQPPFNPNNNRLSLLTYQQKLLDDRLVIEFGRTHPDRYYGLPPCNSINSCFQDLFYINAGFTSPLYAVWGANAAYQLWRADGGQVANPTPTAISLYTGTGYAFDPTIPIRFNSFFGVLLQAPDQSRPNDTYGLKVNWQRLNENYTQFLSEANFISGGTGAPYARDKFVFEANAHLDVGAGVILEPVVQYVVNPNTFWNPYTARRAKDGFYGGFTLVVPLGTLLGLAPG
ncbi:porin [Methylobacterium radiotolerans]|uniref:Porin n=1 Tax=Methylobacterium radiotolerans TaxID=31998 RepID=A0ABU7TFT5_9HYPH